MKTRTIWIPIIIVVFVFVGIALFDSLGLWETESTKVPATIKEGEFAGLSDPNDIRGSYSFGDIEAAFGVPAALIAEAFGVQTDRPSEVLAKDLEAMYPDLEVGTGSIRAFVGIYTGLPFDVEDGLPDTVRTVLIASGKWTEALEETYKDRIIHLTNITEVVSTLEQPETSEEHEAEEGVVKGKTTAAEVMAWGLTQEAIEEVVGGEIENSNMTIRDICGAYGTSFGEVKVMLNELLNP